MSAQRIKNDFKDRDRAAIGIVWNEHRVLRHGDILGQPGEHSCHANQYSLAGVLKSSWGPGAIYELVSRRGGEAAKVTLDKLCK